MESGCLYVLRKQSEPKTESQPVVVDVSSDKHETEGVSPTPSSSKALIGNNHDDNMKIRNDVSKSTKVTVLLLCICESCFITIEYKFTVTV